MGTTFLIGAAAGLTAAFLMALSATGSFLTIGITYAVALPIMAATLGRGRLAGATAVLVSAVGLTILFSALSALGFALVVALPAFLLSAMANESSHNGLQRLYPSRTGKMVAYTALYGAGLASIGAFLLGPTFKAYDSALDMIVEAMLKTLTGTMNGQSLAIQGMIDIPSMIALLKTIMPPAMVGNWAFIAWINLWAACALVRRVYGLPHPRLQFETLLLPSWAAPLLVASGVASIAGGMVGVVAWFLIGGLTAAFAILGFAVLHTVTRGLGPRIFTLTFIYLSCGLLGWPVLGIALIGLVDQIFHIRDRGSRRRGLHSTDDNF